MVKKKTNNQNYLNINIKKILKEYLSDKKYPVGCSSKGTTHHGIMPGHVFSLLEFRSIYIKNEKLDVVKIFNP